MTILDHFIQFKPILDYFRPYWVGTLSKIMGNFKILAKAVFMCKNSNTQNTSCKSPLWQNAKIFTLSMKNSFFIKIFVSCSISLLKKAYVNIGGYNKVIHIKWLMIIKKSQLKWFPCAILKLFSFHWNHLTAARKPPKPCSIFVLVGSAVN